MCAYTPLRHWYSSTHLVVVADLLAPAHVVEREDADAGQALHGPPLQLSVRGAAAAAAGILQWRNYKDKVQGAAGAAHLWLMNLARLDLNLASMYWFASISMT